MEAIEAKLLNILNNNRTYSVVPRLDVVLQEWMPETPRHSRTALNALVVALVLNPMSALNCIRTDPAGRDVAAALRQMAAATAELYSGNYEAFSTMISKDGAKKMKLVCAIIDGIDYYYGDPFGHWVTRTTGNAKHLVLAALGDYSVHNARLVDPDIDLVDPDVPNGKLLKLHSNP
jgi:hypothetical protein